ncbi:hypothetical protein C8R47DRAFT_1063489 [Mycena vitilis]|nr:hypothetical protein C8R47DRAFT_1063489 [Mycena vitilis]
MSEKQFCVKLSTVEMRKKTAVNTSYRACAVVSVMSGGAAASRIISAPPALSLPSVHGFESIRKLYLGAGERQRGRITPLSITRGGAHDPQRHFIQNSADRKFTQPKLNYTFLKSAPHFQ